MPDYTKQYEFKPTDVVDTLTIKNNNPYTVYMGEERLTPRRLDNGFAYSDGKHIWKISDEEMFKGETPNPLYTDKNFIPREEYPDAINRLAQLNPDYANQFYDMYGDFLDQGKAERLLKAYEYAGSPTIQSYAGDRAFYSPYQNTIYASPDYFDGFNDVVAELAHPLQEKYGNNSNSIELLNPAYDHDNFRGKTRYDFPDKFESETHEDFEPLLLDYILEDALYGQHHYTLESEGKLGNHRKVLSPTFEQVMDSARTYNKRKQDLDYQYSTPRSSRTREKDSFIGNLWAYGGPLVRQANMFKTGGNIYDGKTEYSGWMNKVKENGDLETLNKRILEFENGSNPMGVREKQGGFYLKPGMTVKDSETGSPIEITGYKTYTSPTLINTSDYYNPENESIARKYNGTVQVPIGKDEFGKEFPMYSATHTLPEVEVKGHRHYAAEDIDKVFGNMLTGGYSSIAESAGEDWEKKNYLTAALKFASPLFVKPIISNPATTAYSGIASTTFGTAFDKAMQEFTGKDWGTFLSDKLPITKDDAALLNPVTLLTGAGTAYASKKVGLDNVVKNLTNNVGYALSSSPKKLVNDIKLASFNNATRNKGNLWKEMAQEDFNNAIDPKIHFNPFSFFKNSDLSFKKSWQGIGGYYMPKTHSVYINPKMFLRPSDEFKSTLGHEIRHGYQGVFKDALSVEGSNYQVPNQNYWLYKEALSPFEGQAGLGRWAGSPDELDAEMYGWKIKDGLLNTPYEKFSPDTKLQYIQKAANRFWLLPEEAANTLDLLSKDGYFAVGGPLVQQANKFEMGGPKKNLLPEVVITPDESYNRYLNTLPDNQRLSPAEEYDSYLYWKLNNKPRDFQEALGKEMFHYNKQDKSYHSNSIAWGDDGVGYFMKPKTHPTVHMETDRYNKGLIYEDDGTVRQETPEEKAAFDNIRNNYDLIDDPSRSNYYRYQPKNNKYGGGSWLNTPSRTMQKILDMGNRNTRSWIPAPNRIINEIRNVDNNNIGGYFLPEVTVKPDGSLQRLQEVLPDQDLRNDFYRGYSNNPNPRISLGEKADRLWDIWNRGGRPSVDAEGSFINNIGGAFNHSLKERANSIGKTIYLPAGKFRNFNTYLAELAHSIQYNDDSLPHGLHQPLRSAVWDIVTKGTGDAIGTVDDKGRQFTNYYNPNHFEGKAHRIIEPSMHEYLNNSDVESLDEGIENTLKKKDKFFKGLNIMSNKYSEKRANPRWEALQNSFEDGGNLDNIQRKDWDSLSMKEKSEMIKIAIQNGITDLVDIKNKYNEMALGEGQENENANIYGNGSPLRRLGQSTRRVMNNVKSIGRATQTAISIYNNPNASKAMQYFINKGLAPHQAAGLVGNLMRESTLNPKATNPGSKAYGLAQWLGSRRKELFRRYGSQPSFNQQLDFVWWELNNTHKNGLKYLTAARNAEEAARAGMNWYEFSNGDAISEMNRWGQDGRGSMRKGIEFASKLAGQPVPDLSYLNNVPGPQQSQVQQIPMQMPQIPMYMPAYRQQQMLYYPQYNNTFFALGPYNPAVNNPAYSNNRSYNSRQRQSQPLVDTANEYAKALKEKEIEDKKNGLNLVLNLVNRMNPSSDGNSYFGGLEMLANPSKALGMVSAYGGRLFKNGGYTEEGSKEGDNNPVEEMINNKLNSMNTSDNGFFPAIGSNMRSGDTGETGQIVGIDEEGKYMVKFPGQENTESLTLLKNLPEVVVQGTNRNPIPFKPKEEEPVSYDFTNARALEYNPDTYQMDLIQPGASVIGTAPRFSELDEEDLAKNNYIENSYDEDFKRKVKESPDEIRKFQRMYADAGGYDLNPKDMTDTQIRQLQKRIGANVDGNWGPESIQKWREYNVDGKWGKRTEKAFKYYNEQGGFNWERDVPTKNTEWCAEWVHKKVDDATGNNWGVHGNAWRMPYNIVNNGGTMIYNLYADDAFKSVGKSVQKLRSATEDAIRRKPFDISNLQIGDVVGIYMPSSDKHIDALKTGTTFNTHVGIVTGFDKDGYPLVEHNIHRVHHKERADRIKGSRYGKPTITVVARPDYAKLTHPGFYTNDATSPYTKNDDSPLFKGYANSIAGSKSLMTKIFPNIDVDEVERITLAVQGRETGFMKNRKSDQTGLQSVKNSIEDFYRDTIKRKNPNDVSSNLSKLKMSTFSAYERKMLGINSRKDLEDPKIAGRAAMYVMSKNYSYFKNLQSKYPNLGLTDDDIRYLTELSYNQGMDKLKNIGFDARGLAAPGEIQSIREMSKPDAKIKDISSTNYRHLGGFGEWLYDNFGEEHTPYISAAEKYRQDLIDTANSKK